MRKGKIRKVNTVRNIIISFLTVLVATVGAYGIFYSAGPDENSFIEGKHYTILKNSIRKRPGQALVVEEFFSYGCIHCWNFEALIDKWEPKLGPEVIFNRSPVAFTPNWPLLAQSYHALESLDSLEPSHERIFNAIHAQGREINSLEDLASFLDGTNITDEEFKPAFQSTDVVRETRKSRLRQQVFQITSVRTLIVANKYSINMDFGRKNALAVADYLLDKELAKPQ